MTKALFVRVTTGMVGQGGAPVMTSWLVATSDPAEAVQAVRALNPTAPDVRMSDDLVPEGTLERYNLKPGQAHKL